MEKQVEVSGRLQLRKLTRKYILIALKLSISFGLLYFFINKARFSEITDVISGMDGIFLILSVFLFIFITYVLTYRWFYMSEPFNQNLSQIKLFKYYLYAYYFNNFLPTSIGGDIVRAIKIGQDIDSRSTGLATVIIDRLVGILATLTFATFGLYWTATYFRSTRIVYFAVVFSLVVIVLLNILLNPRVYSFFKLRLISKIKIFNLGERIIKVLDSVHLYREEKTKLFFGYIMAMIAQALTVIFNYVIALGLGVNLSLGYLFFAIPISFLVTLAPSINGLGVREGSYVILLSKIHVPMATAMSISLLVIAVQIFISMFGGIFWIFEKNKKEVNQMVSEA